MAKRKRVRTPKKPVVKVAKPAEKITDFEEFLINKIDKCQRIVQGLGESPVWQEIREDYEATSKSLDASWAFADGNDPKFRQAQAAKMAAQTFMNMQQNYEHDLNMAKKQLKDLKSPNKVIKKDFDEEGIIEPEGQKQANAYHG